MHDNDDVPLLSGDLIRHEVASLRVIDEYCKDMDLVEKAKLILGKDMPSDTLIKSANDAFHMPLPTKQGMPVLAAPVMVIAWACKKKGTTGKFDVKLCDSMLLAKNEIYIDPESVMDHYPTRYERAFTNIIDV